MYKRQNDKSVYPMMSVFKVHQALALCNDFDNKGISLMVRGKPACMMLAMNWKTSGFMAVNMG